MKTSLNKRLLCLILAVELICTPLAMAWAQAPAAASKDGLPWDEPVPETPVGEESLAADLQEPDGNGEDRAETLAEDAEIYYKVAVAFGQANTGLTDTNLTRYLGRFRPEVASEKLRNWGCRTAEYDFDLVTVEDNEDGTFTVSNLPTAADLGRLPGLVPDGWWYLYPGVGGENSWWQEYDPETYEWNDTAAILKAWQFDEAHPELYSRFAPMSDDGTATVTAAQMEAWRDAFGCYHYEGTDPEWDPDSDTYCIPLIAGWKVSHRSEITLLALDTAREDSGEKTPVTQLYTKPFRQAAESDRLTSAAYGPVDYQIPAPVEDRPYNTEDAQFEEANAFVLAGTDTRELYLRVAEEQESLSLRFQTYEPYYQYNLVQGGTGESPVTVSASFNGETLEGVSLQRQWADDGQCVFPCALPVSGGNFNAQNNNAGLEARGQWTVVNIPLHKVSDAADAVNDPYTTITITVYAPDGLEEHANTYTLYVERLMTPYATLGYGNTPAGVIAKDTTGYWGGDVGANKERAIADFTDTRYMGRVMENGNALAPGSVYFRRAYDKEAWRGVVFGTARDHDVDSDRTAIVAYQDRAFADPGVVFVDSEGRQVIFGDSATEEAYRNCVTRTITLARPQNDGPLTVDAVGETCYYTQNAEGEPILTAEKASQTLHNADGSDVVDLRGLKVLPGVYTMEYTFLDPVLEESLTIRRPLVVLPIPGDADMDGAVTIADAQLIDEKGETWGTEAATQLERLYAHRVVNVQQSNYLGAEAIRRGFRPAVAELSRTDYFYPILPTGSAGERYTRRTWESVSAAGAGGATLRLEFLGVEKGTWQTRAEDGDIYTNGLSGPWEANTTAGVSIVNNPTTATSGSGDVFWMGVYLENAGELEGAEIEQISLALTYDSQYIRPARVHAYGAADGQTTPEDKWRVNTLLYYNLLDGSKKGTIPMTTFSGMTGGDYRYSFSTPERSYEQNPHYSKVIGDLEQDYTGHQLNVTYLKEAVFSLQGTQTSYRRAKLNGGKYLLVLPFRLVKHPAADRIVGPDGEMELAQLVELSAGMRDFTLVTKSVGRALPGASAARVAWMAERMEVPAALAAAGTQTYAFSAQDAIYGGETRNLRDTLTYESNEESAGTGLIRIGEDKTERIKYTATYDTAMRWDNQDFFLGTVEEGALPPGLELHEREANISGTPTRAGTYRFTIQGIPYEMTVEKKTIRYTANSQTSYYGQPEFRGNDSDDFTFTFTMEDLAKRDRDNIRVSGGATATVGTGMMLGQALSWEEGVSYREPTFRAIQSNGLDPVAEDTGVGRYDIRTYDPPSTTNYNFIYNSGSTLTIRRRPVWISHLTISQDRSGARTYNDQNGYGISLSIAEQEGEELIHLTTRPADQPSIGESGMYQGYPLSDVGRVAGDRLALTYVANFQQEQKDLDYQIATGGDKIAYPFYLQASEEPRNLRQVSGLNLNDNRFSDLLRSPNYDLQVNTTLDDASNQIVGTVIRRGVQAISMDSYPFVLRRNEDGEPVLTARYGDTVNDHYNLRVSVTRGGMDDSSGETIVGSYDYNAADLQPMDIHYNWVSPAQKAAGESGETLGAADCLAVTNWDPSTGKDLLPYGPNTVLTPAMDGYYLCAAVLKYEAGGSGEEHVTYIKTYSKYPVRVEQQDLTLTIPNRQGRYYGEEGSAVAYTYNFNQLVAEDRQWVRDYVENYNAAQDQIISTNSQAALEALLREKYADDTACRLPQMEVSTVDAIPTAAQRATAATPAVQTCYLVLHGGASAFYKFRYGANNATDFGSQPYTIERRPIVVDDIYSNDANRSLVTGGAAPAEGPHKTHYDAIYADAKNLYLRGYTADKEHVTFSLPNRHGEDGLYYYYRDFGAGTPIDVPAGYTYQNPDPVLEQDRDKLQVTYSVRFLPDEGHSSWRTFTDNYYSVQDLNNVSDGAGYRGTAQRKVEICDLTLAGDPLTAANYVLVYKSSEGGVHRAPANAEEALTRPDPRNNGQPGLYLVHGTGTVTLRPIVDLTFDSLSCTEYTYGAPYTPEEKNPVTGKEMVVRVHYNTALDEAHNDMENAYASETVTFVRQLLTSTTYTTSFAQRGFTIYYQKPGQSKEEARDNGQIIDTGDPMLPGEHHGAKIFIVGQRRAADAPIISQLSADTLVVTKRPLRLNGPDGHKFYGENNPAAAAYEDYTFAMSDLAPRDREKLAEEKGVDVSALGTTGTKTDLELLSRASGWGFGAITPQYGSTATNRTPVGDYQLTMTLQGSLNNYSVTCTPGTLHIYRRPVVISSITSDADDPVYTIYNQSSSMEFRTQLDTNNRVNISRINDIGTVHSEVWTVMGADGNQHDVTLSGPALAGDDRLAFNVMLTFYNQGDSNWSLSDTTDAAKPQVRVEFIGLTQSDVNANYSVSNAGAYSADGVWGAIKLRTIDSIYITRAPKMTGYTYGDALDLSGLEVTVLYKSMVAQEIQDTVSVNYIGPEQFRSYGLYVNYWDVTDSAPTDDDACHELPTAYRRADTGDHITIAATHDTRQYAANPSPTDPMRRPFAANGKTLIISAFQDTTVAGNQTAAEPKILRSYNSNTGRYDGSDIQTIRIAPLPLRYTLSAADKTYDGTTQAAGTLVLQNVFDRERTQVRVEQSPPVNGVVSVTPITAHIVDDIFIPMGNAATPSVVSGTMTFTTGTYDGAEQFASILNPNARIRWTPGYTEGSGTKLTFTFVNPNVHYLEQGENAPRGLGADNAAYWRASQAKNTPDGVWDFYREVCQMPVEVTGMVIQGPDAANYTWDAGKNPQSSTTVTMTTRTATENGQAAAPYATIHKANRSALQGRSLRPDLSVDIHTNAVRLGFGQDLAALNDGADEFADELHFEYALFYERDGLFTTWAGADGEDDHQDTVFFGGEAARPFVAAGYVPDLERLPKPETAGENTVRKGQVYAWAKEGDDGFVIDPTAYPGGTEESVAAYWNYSLYTTARKALPRNTVFYPMVRLSETHNYNPSGDLSGHDDVTAKQLEDAKDAAKALKAEPDNEALQTAAQQATASVRSAAAPMTAAANQTAADKVAADLARSEAGGRDDTFDPDAPLTAAAIKTFTQRLDTISASRERNTAEGADRQTEYLVEMLEAVWFTDTLEYDGVRLLDSVVNNQNPVRYYGYFWNADRTAQLQFNERPIDLSGSWTVTIRLRDGGEEEQEVNPVDETVGGRVAKLYVSTSNASGNTVRTIRITPPALYARLGDAPYQLGTVTDPAKPSNRRYQWSSSNPSVATVDENGLVTFRGEGEATITVSTDNGRSASILVVVSSVLPIPTREHPIFNYRYPGPWEELDENGAFHPHDPMTRAQLVELLDIFLNPDAQWTATAELAYVDVTGREKYYEALSRLTAAGVVEGVPGQAFAGEQLVTRAEFATMLCRMLQLETPDTVGQIHMFEDAGAADTWAYAYIDALAKTGVIRGVGGGNFAPKRVLTREEAAAVIARLLVTVISSDQDELKIPTDMTPANWSYEAVIRAVNTIAYPEAE